MRRLTRRAFLQRSTAAGLIFGVPGLILGSARPGWAAGPNATIRLGILGLGGIDTVGGVGGRGRQLISRFGEVPGVQIAALCDVDQAVLDHELKPFQDRHAAVAAHRDLRRVLDDKTIDAVVIATPNHWHALATVWACQAGKDVYVEKPFCYNIWEGRQMLAAARKYERIVQVGTQRRSSPVLHEAIDYLRRGELGAIRYGHAIVYRAREGIGKSRTPVAIPATVDYDLWCGPSPLAALGRKQLHYDWHWFWSTGNGEIGNNGAHLIDICRWALGQQGPPPRAMSIGGRFGFDDDGETPNTQIALWDYRPAPMICEIRAFHKAKGPNPLGKFRAFDHGMVIDCEGGLFAGDMQGGTAFDRQGRKIKAFGDGQKPPVGNALRGVPQQVEVAHAANFIDAVRSRKIETLNAEARVGQISATCSHMANISLRLGQQSPPEAILASLGDNSEAADAFTRCRDYLRVNGLDLAATPAVLGPWVSFDADREQFTGPFAEPANALCRRAYRAPFVVPTLA